ncbi:chemotaxis protein CheW, partial [Stenotrophomonas maltophilia]|uniref:chemotaxis protein CheW n=1 Tax=Stenotrophomonas maltophilia TaxID=40324 RepID=UPI001F5381D9
REQHRAQEPPRPAGGAGRRADPGCKPGRPHPHGRRAEDGETIGLRVSAVEDVANLTDSQIEPPDTARICQISNDLFRGVARVSQRPMILLDATRLLS